MRRPGVVAAKQRAAGREDRTAPRYLPARATEQEQEQEPARATEQEAAPQEQSLGWEQVRELARRHLHRFLSLEAEVLQGEDPDAIHDFRVASRRLQQILDLLYPPPRPRKIRKLRRTIRRSRQALSEVRNCDVLLDRVKTALARKRAGHIEHWKAFRKYLGERRSERLRSGIRKLSKLNLSDVYVRLQDGMNGSPELPGRGDSDGPAAEAQPGSGLFEDRMTLALQGTWQEFESRVATSREDPDDRSLHAVRIAGKRVRYLMEVIHELGVAGSDKALVWFRRLQQHLGDWHDLDVLEQMMIEMVARPEFVQKNLELAIGMERLLLRNRKTKKGYERKYLQMTANSTEWRELQGWTKKLLSLSHPLTLPPPGRFYG